MAADEQAIYRFGGFVLDPAAFVLRSGPRRIRMERRPMELLILLIERAGQLVSRAEITERLWSVDVFVDTDAGVNTAVRKIRRALRDSPDRPSFVETIQGKGYRFVGALEPATVPVAITLGVLPFANLTGDPSREYVADGFTEETIAALGQVAESDVRVLGRTSMMRVKRSRLSIGQLGRRLGADYLVESAVREAGPALRITSRLVRVSDETLGWAASYDGSPADLLRFERERCETLAADVQVRLSPERIARLQQRQTGSAEAYDLYLRGRHAWNQLTPATTREALRCFSTATEVDPDYALAWSGIADALVTGPITADVDPAAIRERATRAAVTAARVGPDLAEVQTSVGIVKFWLDWSWPAAETALRRAISLDPHYPFACRMLGHVLSQTGRHGAARLALQRAVGLDPFYAMHHALSAQIAFQAADFTGAIRHAERALEVDDRFWVGYHQLAQARERCGELNGALEALAPASQLSSANSKVESLRAYVLAAMGRHDEAVAALDELEARARSQFVPPYALALVNLGLGRLDIAYRWLEQAVAVRDVHLIYLPVDGKWDRCRHDAAFTRVIRACGFPTPPAEV